MTLKNYIKVIENNKSEICKYWIEDQDLVNVLNKYSINKEHLINKYTQSIMEHHIYMIKENKIILDNPIIIGFIKYLNTHQISISDLFILFFSLKKALIRRIFELNIQTSELINEINSHFEKDFQNVLSVYSKNLEDLQNAYFKSNDLIDKYVIMSKSDANGNIIKVSSAFCELSGYTKNELLGQSYNITKHPDTEDKFYENIKKTLISKKIWQGEIKNQKKNADTYWLETTIHPNFDNIGRIVSYDAIGQDITSTKELKNQQSLLVEQSKSAAMGELISMIAHQWRQPLQAVSIYIQKLPLTKIIEGKISDELLDEVINEISSQLEYMSQTIDDFIDYFKPNKEKELVLISTVINKALEFLAYMIKIENIIINIENTCDYKISIFRNEIIQVLINIINNSKDAIKKNKIKIINIRTFCKNNYVYIEIEDNGGGIKEDIIERIFEPYFSTKSNKNGTGLGLYMSQTIINQHSNGQLLVCNTDIGAKFTMKLPLEQ